MTGNRVDMVTAPDGDVAFYIDGRLKTHERFGLPMCYMDSDAATIEVRAHKLLMRPLVWPVLLEDALNEGRVMA